MKTARDIKASLEKGRRTSVNITYMTLHVIMLALSIFLVISISIDSFKGDIFYGEPRFMKTQLWICIVFLVDFFIEFFMAKRKWHYLYTHFVFFLVSIPYLQIIQHYGWTFSTNVMYLLQFIPLVRGGYAMAIIVGWFAYNKATGLFVTYLVTLLATVYFASLVFFMFEHPVNPGVTNYRDALWWSMMDVTTVGCSINAVTSVGRILSVLLAALGMMMFPVFTVYITSLIMSNRTAVISQMSSHSLINNIDDSTTGSKTQDNVSVHTTHTRADDS
ncbi:MAG: potassium channel family protein [Clostridiales bacterium]|nr:potassium channel family protein [Clostridiales bacterium]